MEIGLVENYIRDHCVVLWLYKREGRSWKKIHSHKCHVTQRQETLKMILRRGANIVPLGRGT